MAQTKNDSMIFLKSEFVGGICDGKITDEIQAGIGNILCIVSNSDVKGAKEFHLYRVELNETGKYPITNRLIKVQQEEDFDPETDLEL